MKSVKFGLMAIGGFIGIAAAIAGSHRVTFTYTNQTNNGTFIKVASYNPLKCVTIVTLPCEYTSPVDLGPTASTATLISAGAIPSPSKSIYHN